MSLTKSGIRSIAITNQVKKRVELGLHYFTFITFITNTKNLPAKTESKATTMPTNFLSLPRELRHAILLQTLDIEVPVPEVRKPDYQRVAHLSHHARDAQDLTYWIRQNGAYHVYRDEYAKILKEISPWAMVLNKEYDSMDDDLKYVKGKWMETAKAQVKRGAALCRGLFVCDVV